MTALQGINRIKWNQRQRRPSSVVCRAQGFGQLASSVWTRAVELGNVIKDYADLTVGAKPLVPQPSEATRGPASSAPAGSTSAATSSAAAVTALETSAQATPVLENGSARSQAGDVSTTRLGVGGAGTTSAAEGARATTPGKSRLGVRPAAGASPPSSAPSSSATSSVLRLEVQVVNSISKVAREEWDALVCGCQGGEVNPFLLWSFLSALEESGSAGPRTGWLPQHIIVREGNAASSPAGGSPSSPGRLVGGVVMYLKGHSYGEYVFDSSWANFAQMLGVRYYPKLQAAVPFTPVTGPRLLVADSLAPGARAAVVREMGRKLIDMTESSGLSGVHLTFTTAQEWAVLAELGFKQRLGIQFHWENPGYDTFDDFLGDLKQSKRKSIRQERKSVHRAGLTPHRLPGAALGPGHWDRFYSFYHSTVDRKWGNAYLTREFFHRLGDGMADRILLMAASESNTGSGSGSGSSSSTSCGDAPAPGAMMAAALNLVGSHALFGRNWGQAEGRDYKNLHFELCYYQALEEAIARRLPRVEAGAQGEHKLQRGYLPSFTYSCHYLRDPRLGGAVDTFLRKERGQIEYTLQMMSVTASPYKKERTVESLVSKLQAYNSLSSGSGSGSEWDMEPGLEEGGEGGEGGEAGKGRQDQEGKAEVKAEAQTASVSAFG